MRWFLRLPGILLLSVAIVAIGRSQVLPYPAERFDRGNVPIFDSRIFRVSDEAQSRALGLLSDRDFLPANPQILKELFGDRVFETKEMLAAQASAARKYAKKREEEAATPFFGDHRVWMAAQAKAHRELADYTEKLSPDLYPYLVKSQIYFEGTGGFTVILKDRILEVHHGSLGQSTPPKTAVVILVFLERKIDGVRISTSIAE
jgi:hypothetical protein